MARAEYYGIIDGIALTKRERDRYCDSNEMLDNATCGRLLIALKNHISLQKEYWVALERAVDDRNYLAHKFLVQFDYGDITEAREKDIIDVIRTLFFRIRNAVIITRTLRESLDGQTTDIEQRLASSLERIGIKLDKA